MPHHAGTRRLRRLAARVVTRHHAHHYLGFSANQWQMFQKESPRRVKPLLYTFRTLLTGLHLMRTGETEANLTHLNAEVRAGVPGRPDGPEARRGGEGTLRG
ncbi:hypothetical protein CTI14_29135 [Methylobacterium radiotolerans]|nr:hypothetical protein CTI14_29135 [Methylobacterium radiotolerans]